MKKLLLAILLISVATVYAQKKKEYTLDTSNSVINWTGSYLFHFSDHTGTVAFKKGKLFTKDGAITGGSFLIDMTTISNEEYRLDNSNGPIGHLKNSDFFDVTVYPEARLELTKVTYFSNTNEHTFDGDLTIKGVSNPIMIKAMVDDTTNTIKTRFKINRQEWGIDYKSKFKDSAISDAIEFDVTLQF